VPVYDEIAQVYDRLWPRTDDLSFYLKLAAESGGPVLELGCGTGRTACAVAKAVDRVVGLDLSANMLTEAARRRETIGLSSTSVEFVHGSMTDFRIGESFNLIIAPFSALWELESSSERVATFGRCLEHLTPTGVFAFDCSFKGEGEQAHWGMLRQPHILRFVGDVSIDGQSDTNFFDSEVPNAEGRRLSLFLDQHEGTALRRRVVSWTRQYANPADLRNELQMAGFRRIEVFGGFNGEALYDASLTGRGRQIFLAWREQVNEERFI
jgi:SAM-dependent methyltransferase